MFLPFGLDNAGIVDPMEMARDFAQALAALQKLDQHRYKSDTFNDPDVLTEKFAKVMTCSTEASIGVTSVQSPVITRAAGDANLFHVPYNRGLEEVEMAEAWPEWTSEYPELVLCAFSFQWCRATNANFNSGNGANVRLQMRVAIDGAPMPGSGPFSYPLDGNYRGAGLGERSVFSTAKAMAFLPAGSHRVVAMAGQPPAFAVDSDFENDGAQPWDDPPTDKVVLGRRGLIVLRCAVARPMRG
jgi:hypothetical protein